MTKFKLMFIFWISIVLSACSITNIEMGHVEKPSLDVSPINGKWTISKCIFKDDNNDINFDYRSYIGKDVIFKKDGVIIAELNLKNPTFKSKKVNVKKYFDKIGLQINDISLNSEYIYIIKAYDNYNSYEIIIAAEDTLYIILDDIILKVTKVSDTITDEEYKEILERYS